MTIDEDKAVVREVQRGRTEAFAQLVDRHKDRVYGMLMRLTGDPQTAEELAHEAFVRAYQGLDNFRGESRFGTWLIQIAVNLARDRLREFRRGVTVSLDALLEQGMDDSILADTRPAYDPLDEMEERDLMETFESALEELPPDYREIFVLHHLQHIPYEQIAEMTGDAVGALKVRAHRARKLLKTRMFPELDPAPRKNILDEQR